MDPNHSSSKPIILGLGSTVSADDAERIERAMRHHQGSPAEFIDFSELSVPQRLDSYTPENQAVWQHVMRHRLRDIHEHGCAALRGGVRSLDLSPDRIPNLKNLNSRTQAVTGWQIAGIATELSPLLFAQFLSQKICPVVVGIRSPDQPLTDDPQALPTFCFSEVDSDLCSAVLTLPPLLLNNSYASFLERWGLLVSRCLYEENRNLVQACDHLACLFDMTILRGVIEECGGEHFYGAQFTIGELVLPFDRYTRESLLIEGVTDDETNSDRKHVSTISDFTELHAILDQLLEFHPGLGE